MPPKHPHTHAFIPHKFFNRIDAHATTREYQNKQAIFGQGDKADAMFYIQSGNVKLTAQSAGGRKAVTGILRRGDFFGESCLAARTLRRNTATAIQASTISRVTRVTLARIIHQEPAFAKLFIAYLLFRISRSEAEFVDQVVSSSEKRLARILLLLADHAPRGKPAPVPLSLSQEMLAEMVGTTRSRVSYFMNRFRKRGFIDYNGSLRVHKALRTFLLQE